MILEHSLTWSPALLCCPPSCVVQQAGEASLNIQKLATAIPFLQMDGDQSTRFVTGTSSPVQLTAIGAASPCADADAGRIIDYSWNLVGVAVDTTIADAAWVDNVTLTSSQVRQSCFAVVCVDVIMQ